MTLEEFLRTRDIPEETIKYFVEQKIDCEAICAFSEEELKDLLPAQGDRVAIKHFSRRNSSTTKQSLIERLKMKMTGKDKKSSTTQKSCKQNAGKQTRLIEIGWLCMCRNENRYRQVRAKSGGGTRRVNIPKMNRCIEVLEIAKNLFFPNGISPKGTTSEFEFELMDFKSNSFDTNMTIQEMYDMAGLAILRFYLATIRKDKENEGEDDFIPASIVSTSTIRSRPNTRSLASTSNFRYTSIPSESTNLDGYTEEDNASSYLSNFSEELNEVVDDSSSSTNKEESDITYFHIADDNLHDITTIPLNEIQPRSTTETLILHRGQVFQELLQAVMIRQIDISVVRIEMILPNGMSEPAEDIGGVLRDSITEFFEDFYEKCTLGTDLKVPCLRHDFQEEEWNAIGQIIVQSYLSEQYFPIQIAPVFFKSCLDIPVDNAEVLSNFLKYISVSDAALLRSALNNYEDVDQNYIIEFFSNYDGKWMPTKDNLEKNVGTNRKGRVDTETLFRERMFRSSFEHS